MFQVLDKKMNKMCLWYTNAPTMAIFSKTVKIQETLFTVWLCDHVKQALPTFYEP